jgi:hypothetical protein
MRNFADQWTSIDPACSNRLPLRLETLMPVILFPIAAAILHISQDPGSCTRYDPAVFAERINSVHDAKDSREKLASLGQLSRYWRETCRDERNNTSKESIAKLSRLLDDPVNTFVVSSILLDAGNNRFALKAVKAAVTRYEIRRHRYPLPPGIIQNTSWDALICVQQKIETGREINRYCRVIRSAE